MNKGIAIWLTGLSGSGKTTIAQMVRDRLKQKYSMYRVQLLDGDILREGISKHLGFSKEDRFSQIKQAVFISKLLTDHGVLVISSFITPYQQMRDYCRSQLDNYLEIFVKCPLEECIKRDVKGLYKKALRGEIDNFTGISDPFEEPENPDFIIDTMVEQPEKSADRVIEFFLRQEKTILSRKGE